MYSVRVHHWETGAESSWESLCFWTLNREVKAGTSLGVFLQNQSQWEQRTKPQPDWQTALLFRDSKTRWSLSKQTTSTPHFRTVKSVYPRFTRLSWRARRGWFVCILIVILRSTAGISWSLIKNSCLNIIMSVKTHLKSNFKSRIYIGMKIYPCMRVVLILAGEKFWVHNLIKYREQDSFTFDSVSQAENIYWKICQTAKGQFKGYFSWHWVWSWWIKCLFFVPGWKMFQCLPWKCWFINTFLRLEEPQLANRERLEEIKEAVKLHECQLTLIHTPNQHLEQQREEWAAGDPVSFISTSASLL